MLKGARTFDEVNNLVKNKRSEPYEDYFSGMDLTEEQKQERIEFSEKLEKSFLPAVILLFLMRLYGTNQWDDVLAQMRDGYTDALKETGNYDEYMQQHVDSFLAAVREATESNPDDPYFYSMDRVMFMAEEEANTAYQHKEFIEAILAGKTRKKWIDVRDSRERKTHLKVGGTTKPILEAFSVGDSFMLYPKDAETFGADPKEYINCRCTVQYY